MTQKQRVLSMLEVGPVCGTVLLNYRIPRYAARIGELRNDGHDIVTRRCQHPSHSHHSHQIEYVLAPPGQLALGPT